MGASEERREVLSDSGLARVAAAPVRFSRRARPPRRGAAAPLAEPSETPLVRRLTTGTGGDSGRFDDEPTDIALRRRPKNGGAAAASPDATETALRRRSTAGKLTGDSSACAVATGVALRRLADEATLTASALGLRDVHVASSPAMTLLPALDARNDAGSDALPKTGEGNAPGERETDRRDELALLFRDDGRSGCSDAVRCRREDTLDVRESCERERARSIGGSVARKSM